MLFYSISNHFRVTLAVHLHRPFRDLFKPTFCLLLFCLVQQRFFQVLMGNTNLFTESAKYGHLLRLPGNFEKQMEDMEVDGSKRNDIATPREQFWIPTTLDMK
jgi:hypothetical protein